MDAKKRCILIHILYIFSSRIWTCWSCIIVIILPVIRWSPSNFLHGELLTCTRLCTKCNYCNLLRLPIAVSLVNSVTWISIFLYLLKPFTKGGKWHGALCLWTHKYFGKMIYYVYVFQPNLSPDLYISREMVHTRKIRTNSLRKLCYQNFQLKYVNIVLSTWF